MKRPYSVARRKDGEIAGLLFTKYDPEAYQIEVIVIFEPRRWQSDVIKDTVALFLDWTGDWAARVKSSGVHNDLTAVEVSICIPEPIRNPQRWLDACARKLAKAYNISENRRE